MKLRGWKMENGEWRDSVLDCGGKPDCPQSEPSKMLFQFPKPLFSRTLARSRTVFAIRKRRRRSSPPAQSKTCWRFMALLVFAVLPVAPTLAQTYSIEWFTMDGGGGTSTGGLFT